MSDAVSINYKLFLYKENYVQKQNIKKQCAFCDFLMKFAKQMTIFLFQPRVCVDA